MGTAAHAAILEGADAFRVVLADDWRTKAAQEQRAAIRAEGKTPLLAAQAERLLAMKSAAKRQLEAHEPPRPFSDGTAEETLIWQEHGIWCRARLDWLHADGRTVDDLKTVGGSANPDAWSRTLFNFGYDIQAAFYLRGVRAVLGTDATFRFVLLETHPPYALSVVSLTPAALEVADRKVRLALNLWADCLEQNRWPGYPQSTCYIDAPPWELAKAEALDYMENA